MIDKKYWSPEELMVFEAYDYKCVICGFMYADTLHHEPPRSLNPRWKDEPWKQYPLCAAHHDTLQDMPRADALEIILDHVDIYAPGAPERIRAAYDIEL